MLEDPVQLDLPLQLVANDRADRALRIWLLAADTKFAPTASSLQVFIDPETGRPAFSDDDIVLQRTAAGRYAIFGPDGLSRTGRRWLAEELVKLVRCGQLRARQGTPIEDLLSLSFAPGRARTVSVDQHVVDARTDLEELLLQATRLASTATRLSLRACELAEDRFGGTLHPAVRAVLGRRFADAFRQVRPDCSDEDALVRARSAYSQAQKDFSSVGLTGQARGAREQGARLTATDIQLNLPGLEPEGSPNEVGLRCRIGRACAFSIVVQGVDFGVRGRPGVYSAYRSLGEIDLPDVEVIDCLRDRVSPVRRPTATISKQGGALVVRAGLHDEMRLLLGQQPPDAPQDGVQAIRISCKTLDFADGALAMFPIAPAVFIGRPNRRGRHEIAVRVSMLEGDNLALKLMVPDAIVGTVHYI